MFRESLKENMKASIGARSMDLFRHNLKEERKAVFISQMVIEDTKT